MSIVTLPFFAFVPVLLVVYSLLRADTGLLTSSIARHRLDF